MAMACYECNVTKGVLTPEEFGTLSLEERNKFIPKAQAILTLAHKIRGYL